MNDEGCPRSALLTQTPNPEARVDADMDTLATALYVRTDDLLKDSPQLARWRPAAGIDPALSDAELGTLAVMQALLGYNSDGWSAAGGGRPPAARSWPDGPGTGTAPVTRGTSGACACICSPLCTACRPASRSPAPGPASPRDSRASSMPDPER